MADSFRLDSSALKAMLAGPSGPVYTEIRNKTQQALNLANRFVPVDGGGLASSLAYEVVVEGGSPVGRVGFNKEYGIYVHEGTGLYGPRKTEYVIRPRTKKALAFVWQGKKVVVKSVRIKGMRPRPFLKQALEAL